MENTAQNSEQDKNIQVAFGSDGAGSAVARTLYDKSATQRFAFDSNDEDAKYKIVFVYVGMPDEPLEEFDRLREVLLESAGNKTDLNTDSVEADKYLFKEIVIDVEGYDGEKPQDWHDLIDYEEKKAALGKILAHKIMSDDKEKPLQKRQWGKTSTVNVIVLKSNFNDEQVITKAHFQNKTPADVAAYNVIRSRVSLVDRDLENSAIKIPASMKRKADLFDKLKPKTEGYVGDPPIHHKAAFVTAFFEPKISSAEKK